MNGDISICVLELLTLHNHQHQIVCVLLNVTIFLFCPILNDEPMFTWNADDRYHKGNVFKCGEWWNVVSLLRSDHKSADS